MYFLPGTHQKRRPLADICGVSCCGRMSLLRTSPSSGPQRGYAENRPHRMLLHEAQPTDDLGGRPPLDRLKTTFLQGCFWCATGSGAGDIRPQGTSVRPCCPETSLSVLLRLPWHVIEASSCPGLPPSPSAFRCQVCAGVGSLPASSCFSPASRTASPLKHHLHIELCLGGRDLLFRGS